LVHARDATFLFKQLSASKPLHMRKCLIPIFLFFISAKVVAQSQKKITTYFLVQYNKTIYDETLGNNPWGAGLGLQAFFNNKTKFRPTIDVTVDGYLEDDKLMHLTEDNIPIHDDLGSVVNIFLGSSYQLTRGTYLSFSTGPSFSNGRTLPGIKPAFGFYFLNKQRMTGKFSFTHIFNREELTKADFGTLNLSLGIKIF